jgi:hypothetical protein
MSVRIYTAISLLIISLTVYILFTIKDRVSTLNYQLNEIVKQINYERDTIHTLKAERAYLTSPERLRRLSSSYLNLDSIKISQMTKDPLVSSAENDKPDQVRNINLVKQTSVKWRYKNSNNKYLHVVSHTATSKKAH